MGRAFEFRKARKFKRWDQMSKAFTKAGREIALSVKAGGDDPETNPRLRQAIQNAKGVNMPKERIENAIKRASAKDAENLEELVYEGYAPHGIAIVVECTSDNPTRTVANVRMYFTRAGGSLGKTGSLDYLFDRKGVFEFVLPEDRDPEEFELELIDYGADSIEREDSEFLVYTAFEDFGKMQKALEEEKIEVTAAKVERIPLSTNAVESEETQEEVFKLIDRFEDDDDVQAVYHNMEMSD